MSLELEETIERGKTTIKAILVLTVLGWAFLTHTAGFAYGQDLQLIGLAMIVIDIPVIGWTAKPLLMMAVDWVMSI